MKAKAVNAQKEKQGKTAEEGALQARTGKASLQVTDNREVSSYQEALQVMVDHSPRMTAQRRQIEQYHHTSLQRQGLEDEEELMQGQFVQRQPEEEEELLQGEFEPIQREGLEEADELSQGKFKPGSADILQAKSAKPENETGMPHHLKTGLESLSGISLDDVKLHYNSSKPAEIHAHAFTQGKDIHIASGQERHLPHEGWHVVQQMQGRVKPTMQANGVQINDDPGLEKEADVMGERALQMRRPDQNAAGPATRAATAKQRARVPTEASDGSGAATGAPGEKGRLNLRSTHGSARQIAQAGRLSHSVGPDVAQRMAVMATDDMGDETDALVWNNLNWAVKQSGGPVGDLLSKKVWSQLPAGGTIRIVHHGQKGKVGDYDAAGIVSSMQDDLDRTRDTDKPRIGKIIFQSCYAGTGGQGSLVSEMKRELSGIDQAPGVEGRTGVAFGFEGMGEATARSDKATYTWRNPDAKDAAKAFGVDTVNGEYGLQAYCDAMYALRDAITRSGNNVFVSPFAFEYQKPWALIGKSKDEWRGLPEADRRRMVSTEMEPYWKKLNVKMRAFGGFKQEARFWDPPVKKR